LCVCECQTSNTGSTHIIERYTHLPPTHDHQFSAVSANSSRYPPAPRFPWPSHCCAPRLSKVILWTSKFRQALCATVRSVPDKLTKEHRQELHRGFRYERSEAWRGGPQILISHTRATTGQPHFHYPQETRMGQSVAWYCRWCGPAASLGKEALNLNSVACQERDRNPGFPSFQGLETFQCDMPLARCVMCWANGQLQMAHHGALFVAGFEGAS